MLLGFWAVDKSLLGRTNFENEMKKPQKERPMLMRKCYVNEGTYVIFTV